MIITCPNCATRYDVPETAFRDEPRLMRCTACAHKWTAEPPEGGGGPFADSHDQLSRHLEDAERLERNLAALAGRAPAGGVVVGRAAAGGRGGSRLSAAVALAACVALIVGAGWQYRGDVVRAVPATAALYELAGVNVNIRGMEFANIVVEREFENGLPVLAVTGEIVNISERLVDVPRVRFGLRDNSEQEIYHWTMAVASEPLAPDQRARFATRLSAPPSEARDVEVRFHDVGGRRANFVQ